MQVVEVVGRWTALPYLRGIHKRSWKRRVGRRRPPGASKDVKCVFFDPVQIPAFALIDCVMCHELPEGTHFGTFSQILP